MTNPDSRATELSVLERRRHPRMAASGPVILRRSESRNEEVEGELIDVSESGFRAAHGCRTLHSGEVVWFTHAGAEGSARVVWNRIEAERAESGFLILASA
jgi:hypothetical protein